MNNVIASRMRTIHLLGASALVLALGLATAVGAYPLYKSGRESIEKSQTLRKELSALDGLSRTLAQVEADLKQTEGRLTQAEQRLPSRNQMDEFVSELSKVAEEAGLTVSGVTPKPVILSGDYRVLPVEISGEGKFQQCYNFLAGLRRMQRLTRLDEISMDAEQKTGEGSMPGEKSACRLKVSIATFIAR